MDALTARANDIAYSETRRLLDNTQKSKALYERALNSLPQGVGSSFQAGDPYPIYLREGHGSHVWDVDDNEYVDTHGGFGCMVVGHAHPKIVEAITRAAKTGTHFAAPTEDMVLFAEELCRRFQLEKVRFANSGTEATMSAIRVARAATGRDDIVKIEGSYHGHHDQVMFSVVPNADVMGGREMPSSVPMSLGVPKYLEGHTHVVPFNDLVLLERLLQERGNEIACLIIEPVMMNIGIAEPEPGYLQGLKDLLHRFGALLIFDEVKCGAAIAPGGATERYGVRAGSHLSREGDRRRYSRRRVRRTRRTSWRRSNGAPRSRARSTGTRSSPRPASPRSPRCSCPTRTSTSGSSARAWLRGARPRCRSTASPDTRSTSAPRVACPTVRRRCATTATSSRRMTRSSTRRTRGW